MTGTTINTAGLTKVNVTDTLKGDKIFVVTGSQKTRDLTLVEGTIVDYTVIHINERCCRLQAVVQDDMGVLHTDGRTYVAAESIQIDEENKEEIVDDSPIPTIDEYYPHHDEHAELMEREWDKYIATYRMQMTDKERIDWQMDFSRRRQVMANRRAKRVADYLELVAAIVVDDA